MLCVRILSFEILTVDPTVEVLIARNLFSRCRKENFNAQLTPPPPTTKESEQKFLIEN